MASRETRAAMDRNARILAFGAGILMVLVVLLIIAFIATQALPLLARTSILEYLFGAEWLPVSDPPIFQILPFIAGSLFITAFTMLVAAPIGMASAVYISEMAPKPWRLKAKAIFEILAGVPSVIYGLVGLLVMSPLVREALALDSGLSGFTASLLLAVMVLPTVVSLADEAITAVPRDYRDASLALGATPWQTLVNVTIPAAGSGIRAAFLLGFERVLGETMLVLMVAGGRVSVPKSIFSPMRTMTATLAAEVNNTAFGSDHYRALYGIGLVLLLTSLWLSAAAENSARRGR